MCNTDTVFVPILSVLLDLGTKRYEIDIDYWVISSINNESN